MAARDDSLLARSTAMVDGFQLPEPEFLFEIGLAKDHPRLLEGVFERTGGPEILAELARTTGRVLLHGEGGIGKSTIARRLLAHACAVGDLAVLVDLRRWTPSL